MGLSTTIVGYLLLFTVAGFGFVLVNLALGSLLRPRAPHPEKLEIYECGEPTIGSSFVQFDLRFYVVALLFIIFEVEVAFFFPWAVVFGKATQLTQPEVAVVAESESGERQLGPAYQGLMAELGLPVEERLLEMEPAEAAAEVRSAASRLVWTCVADIAVFFGVLLVGFAYVWKRGDLDWVRSMAGHVHTRTDSVSGWADSAHVVSSR